MKCGMLVLAGAVLMSGESFAAGCPVEVKGRDFAWTCRETAAGCVVDFTNKIGFLKRKGKPDVLDPRMLVHAEVTYKPTGKTYTFDIAPTGTLSVALGGPMPEFPARFADTNLYAGVDIPAPFDLGTTADRPSQRIVSQRCHEKFLIKTVPCEMYTRGWILCSVADDPKKERAFTVRITRWKDDFEYDYEGRSKYAMATKLVDFDTAKKEKVGDNLWLVEFPLDLGDIQDVVHTDDHGNFLGQIGRYLDFEVCGPLKTRVSGLNDRTMNTDPERVSAVTFYGARLEKPSATFAMSWTHPGNVFADTDVLETLVDLRVKRPGKYRLDWTVTDGETGKAFPTHGHTFTSDELFRLPLHDYAKPGWYALDWKLKDAAGTVLMTHAASFAMMGRDTRQSKQGEPPYATWMTLSCHYFTPDRCASYNAELMNKAGIRLMCNPGKLPRRLDDPSFQERWKLGPALFEGHLHYDFDKLLKGKVTEEKLLADYRERLDRYPYARVGQIFWESSPKAYQQAPEITGGTFDPANALPDASNRIAVARAATTFLRKHFPEVKIALGHSICCSELIAEQIRAGLPEENLDYMGLEQVGRANLPERPNSASMQTADIFREMAERMGRPKWKPSCGIETNFRRHTFLGQEKQARYYARDVLLGLCWRFPFIDIAGVVDAGNQYIETAWGNDGLCQRWPYMYPKKSYVAYATLTKALDCVTDVKSVPTGDDCAFMIECPRRDGKIAYALWTAYGTAEQEVEIKGSGHAGRVTLPNDANSDGRVVGSRVPRDRTTHISFFGRETEMKPQEGKLRITASGRPQYLIVEGGKVASVRTLKRAYPEDVRPKDYKTAVKCDDAAKWKLVSGKVDGVYGELGLAFPVCRQPAKAPSVKVVQDEELGKCLELDLGTPDLSLPKAVFEYAVLELKEPVPLAGDPKSLGAVVKGNSGWGRLFWILEGADGKRTVSSGHKDWLEDFDDVGKMCLGFTGWRFLSYPIEEHSSIRDYSINLVEDLWSELSVKYPAKLVGVAFSAESRPLFLTERRQKEQKVHISEIGFFD